MWPSSLPPGAQSFQYIWRQRILQGHIYWHIYWKVNKIEVINIYSATYCKWSRGEMSVVTKVIKIEMWDCFSLQIPRTLFRSKAPFGSYYQAVSSILRCYLQIHQMTWNLAHSFPLTPLSAMFLSGFKVHVGNCPQTLDSWFLNLLNLSDIYSDLSGTWHR